MEDSEVSKGTLQIRDYGFRSVEKSNESIVLDRLDIPWMPNKDKDGKPLVVLSMLPVRVTTREGESFLYASAIIGSDLERAAACMDRNTSEQANGLLYTELRRHKDGVRSKSMDSPRTKTSDIPKDRQRDIYYASNGKGGVRVYFIKMQTERGEFLFVRIAACNGKQSEYNGVLPTITTKTRIQLKKEFHN